MQIACGGLDIAAVWTLPRFGHCRGLDIAAAWARRRPTTAWRRGYGLRDAGL